MTEFIVERACAAAEMEFAEQSEFKLPPSSGQNFVPRLIDRLNPIPHFAAC
jgi:uncharacterized protein (DUF1778 family)